MIVDIPAPAPACTKESPDAPGPPGFTRRDPRRWEDETVALYLTSAMLALAVDFDDGAYSRGTDSVEQSKFVPQGDQVRGAAPNTAEENRSVARVSDLVIFKLNECGWHLKATIMGRAAYLYPLLSPGLSYDLFREFEEGFSFLVGTRGDERGLL